VTGYHETMPKLPDALRTPLDIPARLLRDLSAVTNAVGQLPELISGLDGRLRSVVLDLSAVRGTAEALDTQMVALAADLRSVATTVQSADRRVAELQIAVELLAERVVHIDEGLDDRVPDLSAMPDRVKHIDAGLDDRIPDLTPLPAAVKRIERDVARVLELTPDPDEPGPLTKVRDALTPGN
jgi:chromosome segregation ATPase